MSVPREVCTLASEMTWPVEVTLVALVVAVVLVGYSIGAAIGEMRARGAPGESRGAR